MPPFQIQLGYLSNRHEGLPPGERLSCAEAASVCLETNKHQQGVSLVVSGSMQGNLAVRWLPVTESVRRGHADLGYAAERGACCVACHTHIIPRLKKVIDGADPGGITEAVGWKGGGGFRYYRLAPSLLEKDRWGNWVINKEYNAAMLAEALCKLEGFTYAPSDAVYWQHGHSTERDFVYITTATLSHEQLQQLAEEVGSERSLLVLCTAFRGTGDYPNLTVKKIPKQVLSRCEWGHDDYSLQVENLPKAPPKPGQMELGLL